MDELIKIIIIDLIVLAILLIVADFLLRKIHQLRLLKEINEETEYYFKNKPVTKSDLAFQRRYKLAEKYYAKKHPLKFMIKKLDQKINAIIYKFL